MPDPAFSFVFRPFPCALLLRTVDLSERSTYLKPAPPVRLSGTNCFCAGILIAGRDFASTVVPGWMIPFSVNRNATKLYVSSGVSEFGDESGIVRWM